MCVFLIYKHTDDSVSTHDAQRNVCVFCCQMIVSLTVERDCGHMTLAPSPSESPSMSRTESVQHLSVELADAKAKIRRLRQEL